MSKRNGTKRPAVNDWHLWSEVTRTVSPLPKHPAKSSRKSPLDDELEQLLAQAQDPEPLNNPKDFSQSHGSGKLFRNRPPGGAGGSDITWSPSATPIHHVLHDHPNQSIEPKMRRRVRRGQVPIDGRIDLHGLRQSEARSALHRFIAARFAKGDRTLLVITGKGLKKTDPTTVFERGVLRHMLPRWLNEPALAPLIAGYEISAPHHGGEGAYYVRLKRPRGG